MGQKKTDYIVNAEGKSRIVEFENESGRGRITSFNLFDGVQIIYSDFHLGWFDEEVMYKDADIIGFEHCRQGEVVLHDSRISKDCFTSGDMIIYKNNTGAGRYIFPLKDFHSVNILWDISRLKNGEFKDHMGNVIDLRKLRDEALGNSDYIILRSSNRIENLVSELYYQTPETIYSYGSLKAVEFLLFLKNAQQLHLWDNSRYCSRVQLEKVQKIENYITDHYDRRITLGELSEMFDFPLTTMKKCFKTVYGVPIYTYIKSYRMNRAAIMLSQTDKTISDIAAGVGYINAGKFSEAFLETMGCNPSGYRRAVREEKEKIVNEERHP